MRRQDTALDIANARDYADDIVRVLPRATLLRWLASGDLVTQIGALPYTMTGDRPPDIWTAASVVQQLRGGQAT